MVMTCGGSRFMLSAIIGPSKCVMNLVRDADREAPADLTFLLGSVAGA
jgi:hypothetical protein